MDSLLLVLNNILGHELHGRLYFSQLSINIRRVGVLLYQTGKIFILVLRKSNTKSMVVNPKYYTYQVVIKDCDFLFVFFSEAICAI